MYIKHCNNGDCGRPFQVNEFSANAVPATGGTPLLITCPHCGLSCAGSEDYLYLTHPLSADEEIEIGDTGGQAW
jgi:hypothetical protein